VIGLDRAPAAALDEVDLVQAPEVGVEVRAGAADDAGIGQGIAPLHPLGLLAGIAAEGLRVGDRAVGDA
jgi:hypothetical protein